MFSFFVRALSWVTFLFVFPAFMRGVSSFASLWFIFGVYVLGLKVREHHERVAMQDFL
jgi:hypothetical protein